MKHIRKIVLGTVTLGIVALGASAYAGRGGDHHQRILDRIESKLDLTEVQVSALNGLAAEMTETRELMRGGDDLRTQMKQLVDADTFDQGKALGMINDRAAALQANAPELVAATAVFFDSLNVEQKEKIHTLAEKLHRHNGH